MAAGNIHLTLKFFGNVPDDEIDTLALAAREVAQTEEPFQLKATMAGAFPSPKAPRVVWLGLGGDVVPLTRLFHHLEKAFATLGYPPEGRAFNPHLTLGRVKSPAKPGEAGQDAGKNAAGGLAAVCGKGIDFISECFVASGVEVYAVEGDAAGEIINSW